MLARSDLYNVPSGYLSEKVAGFCFLFVAPSYSLAGYFGLPNVFGKQFVVGDDHRIHCPFRCDLIQVAFTGFGKGLCAAAFHQQSDIAARYVATTGAEPT